MSWIVNQKKQVVKNKFSGFDRKQDIMEIDWQIFAWQYAYCPTQRLLLSSKKYDKK